MTRAYTAAPGVDVITSTATIPGFGNLPVNAFVLHGAEPMLVETGSVVDAAEFLDALGTVIDPLDLRWIWLSHTDFDHIGSLHALLSINPRLRVITTFMGTGIMSQSGSPLPMDRVYFANPGDRITFGDRTLTAYKPPVYDNSVTTAFRDETSGLLFTADSFGALLGDIPDAASDLDPAALHHGQTTWVSIDSPWIHRLDRAVFARELSDLRAFDPSLVLSGHLPPAPGTMLTRMLETLVAAVDAPPFAGPGQAFLGAQADAMRLAQVDRFITRAISGLRIP